MIEQNPDGFAARLRWRAIAETTCRRLMVPCMFGRGALAESMNCGAGVACPEGTVAPDTPVQQVIQDSRVIRGRISTDKVIRVSPTDISNTQPGPACGVQSPTTARVWAALGVYILSALAASAVLLVVQPHSGIYPAALSLVQFGPMLGALTTWLAFRKTVAGLLPAAVSARRVGVNILAMVTACVLFWLLITVSAVISGIALAAPAAVGGVSFAVFLPLQLIGAGGEEIGWRA